MAFTSPIAGAQILPAREGYAQVIEFWDVRQSCTCVPQSTQQQLTFISPGQQNTGVIRRLGVGFTVRAAEGGYPGHGASSLTVRICICCFFNRAVQRPSNRWQSAGSPFFGSKPAEKSCPQALHARASHVGIRHRRIVQLAKRCDKQLAAVCTTMVRHPWFRGAAGLLLQKVPADQHGYDR
eukprot:CAMPEP_0181499488 /NCGR_PEP_ID=MMETSP1110-20121109/54690_1 /TAXON_ID=174948 /ORGANISM="Symbiodinium sp., Strain CCMP421" /LENGTH=180 /DNA_ID=CAMNT_0023627687 /DNA_START=146 /DNA_END=685 /DNA_ORIENTATION=+